MITQQWIVVDQEKLRPNTLSRRVALFGPDGEPLVFAAGEARQSDDGGVTEGQLNHLKGRVTRLEKALEEK